MISANYFVLALALLFAPALILDSSAQNLLIDPSFEGTIVYDGAPAVGGWDGFSSTAGTLSGAGFGSGAARTGSQQATLFVNTADQFAGIYQDVLVPAGSKVSFDVWHRAALRLGGQADGIEMRLEYVHSGTGAEIAKTANFRPAALGTSYEPFGITGVVPAGADTVRAVYAISSFSGKPASQRIYVDDASVAVIPEPTSLVLLGYVIGAAIVCYRRKETATFSSLLAIDTVSWRRVALLWRHCWLVQQ